MKTQIKIESNIPIPTQTRNKSKYPWDEVKVGQSFMMPTKIHAASQARYYAQKRLAPKRFTIRTIDANSCRCWRIK